MVQSSKMQGEVKNLQKEQICALRAQLRALCALDHAPEPSVLAYGIDGPSVRYDTVL